MSRLTARARAAGRACCCGAASGPLPGGFAASCAERHADSGGVRAPAAAASRGGDRIRDHERQVIMFSIGAVLLALLIGTASVGIAVAAFGKPLFLVHMILAGLTVTVAHRACDRRSGLVLPILIRDMPRRMQRPMLALLGALSGLCGAGLRGAVGPHARAAIRRQHFRGRRHGRGLHAGARGRQRALGAGAPRLTEAAAAACAARSGRSRCSRCCCRGSCVLRRRSSMRRPAICRRRNGMRC